MITTLVAEPPLAAPAPCAFAAGTDPFVIAGPLAAAGVDAAAPLNTVAASVAIGACAGARSGGEPA